MSLEIINYCPTCASPVYGKRFIAEDEQPVIKRTCNCTLVNPPSIPNSPKSILDLAPKKDITDTMHTK